MNLHFLGICGTFMGSLALLARELGHRVTGSDAGVYPPMSELLAAQGVAMTEGYDPADIPVDTDLVIVGNAMSRGNPSVEHVLDVGLRYTSGPAWLGSQVLPERHVLAVAGTHGKTTTSAMLAHILETAGQAPGFLVGGVPGNFEVSARIGAGSPFVIEADEYDTAFFDKRSKFVHYHPRTLLLNNLEFDHADIFDDLAAIQRQFHHVVRIVPASGAVICNGEDAALDQVLAQGCWTPVQRFGAGGADWRFELLDAAGSAVAVHHAGATVTVEWSLFGRHNAANATAALAAAATVGVEPAVAAAALASFRPPRRRQEQVASVGGVRILDDFAHHPTAIRETLSAVALAHPDARVLAAVELRSNSMRMGAHAGQLGDALAPAAAAWVLSRPEQAFDPSALAAHPHAVLTPDVETLVARIEAAIRPGDLVVFMSNGSFDGAARRLRDRLEAR
ncbi:MAG: UDP-N-acetylmuramate:L-alanyl-gamma-D-glutamyl-meso-diaminopimelate ligase [Pseudomonadota bacterium]